jgi:hypothetical protein
MEKTVEKSDGEGNIIRVPNPDIYEDEKIPQRGISLWERAKQPRKQKFRSKQTHLTPKKQKRK